MDYNRKKGVKWYWWTLLTLYTAGVVYWVLWSDPYLYSQIEFQKALVGRKSNTPQTLTTKNLVSEESTFSQEDMAKFLWGNDRSGSDPTDITRNRKFVEEISFALNFPKGFEPSLWVNDSKGLVFVSKNGHVVAFDWEGALNWQFSPPDDMSFFRPLVLNNQVILASRKGHIYSLDREQGSLQWYIPLAQEAFSEPILLEKTFLIAIRPWTREIDGPKAKEESTKEFKDDLSTGLAEVDIRTGKWLKISAALPFEKEISWSMKTKDGLYLSQDKNLFQIDLSNLTLKNKKDFEAEIVSPTLILPDDLFVPTRDGRVFGLKMNFEIKYESDLGQPLDSSPIYVPLHNRIALITDNGYLHVITADKGERKWRYNLENKSPSSLGWTTRLNGKHIEQLNLGWNYKGWSLWLPCVEKRICIYNPAEGQIIDRIILTGAYMGPPYLKEKAYFFVLKEDQKWKISRFIEKSQAEKQAEAGSTPAPE